MAILRLSHVEVRVPDLELATAYYTEVLGLLETGREPERVFLKCWDEHEHHSVILRYAATYGLERIAPPRLDHIFVTAEDVDEGTRFFRDVLGFRLTEQVVADDGHQLATWLEVSHTPHDIAMVTGPNGGLHHFAFWVDDWNDVRAAADVLAYHGVPIDAGPTRHGATRGYTVYFFDAAGNRNEVFTGGYWVDPDHEPVTWTEAEMGRAIFYYEGAVNQRFLTVHS